MREIITREFRVAQTMKSIRSHISQAKSAEVIHRNLLRAMLLPASADTKRKWRKAAEAKLGELRVQQVVRL